MSEVFNLRTGEERSYSVSPEKAVVNAFYQEHNQNNTWEYDYSIVKYSDSHKTVSCGDWAALVNQ